MCCTDVTSSNSSPHPKKNSHLMTSLTGDEVACGCGPNGLLKSSVSLSPHLSFSDLYLYIIPPSPIYLLSLTTYSLSIFMFQSISIFIPHLFIPLIIHLFICFSICQSSIYLSIAGVSNLFFAAGHIVVVVSFGELL